MGLKKPGKRDDDQMISVAHQPPRRRPRRLVPTIFQYGAARLDTNWPAGAQVQTTHMGWGTGAPKAPGAVVAEWIRARHRHGPNASGAGVHAHKVCLPTSCTQCVGVASRLKTSGSRSNARAHCTRHWVVCTHNSCPRAYPSPRCLTPHGSRSSSLMRGASSMRCHPHLHPSTWE